MRNHNTIIPQVSLALCALAAGGLPAGCAALPESKTLAPLDEAYAITPDRITRVDGNRYCVTFEPDFLQCKLSPTDVVLVNGILRGLAGLRSYHILSITRFRKRPFEVRVELPGTSIILVKKSKSSWDIKYLIDHSIEAPAI